MSDEVLQLTPVTLVASAARTTNGNSGALTLDGLRKAVLIELSVSAAAAALGSELVTNGTFTGNANGWTLGAGWAYAANSVGHTSGTAELTQALALVDNFTYRVALSVGGTTGSVEVFLGEASVGTFDAGDGAVTADHIADVSASSTSIRIVPTDDFDGTIDSVSVKAYGPNFLVYVQQTLNGTDYVDVYCFQQGEDSLPLTTVRLEPFQSAIVSEDNDALVNIGDSTIGGGNVGLRLLSNRIRIKWLVAGSVTFSLKAYPLVA